MIVPPSLSSLISPFLITNRRKVHVVYNFNLLELLYLIRQFDVNKLHEVGDISVISDPTSVEYKEVHSRPIG